MPLIYHCDLPQVTHIIAVYNEEKIIGAKVENTINQHYPKDKINHIFVTDGSDDDTVEILNRKEGIKHLHANERKGKLAAINRIIPEVEDEIIIFSDANAMLSKDALWQIVQHFQNKKVGAVAGEKRVVANIDDDAAGSGENIYWKYESLIKNWESRISSTVGGAGELFAIRSNLYRSPNEEIIVEDLLITMNVIKQGYTIVYEPKALASEKPSKNIHEEMKRKVRISAGGIQSMIHLLPLLNIFKYGTISIFLLSHRYMRWLFAPLALIALLISSFCVMPNNHIVYNTIIYSQFGFYMLALLGYLFANNKLRIKYLFIPFYFVFMHYCVILGFFKLLKGEGTVIWKKTGRR
ncbi:MAG: glycosyltransferase family 2 protein [Saprospiraceae bacterium]